MATSSGVPVATVALGGSENAGILAAQILALGDKELAQKLKDYKKEMQESQYKMQKVGYINFLLTYFIT